MYTKVKVSFTLLSYRSMENVDFDTLKSNTIYRIRQILHKYKCIHTGSYIDSTRVSMYVMIAKCKLRYLMLDFEIPLKVRVRKSYFEYDRNCCYSDKYSKHWVTDKQDYYIPVNLQLYNSS